MNTTKPSGLCSGPVDPSRPREGVIGKRALSADFVVVGGGLAGVCAAVAAARHGASVLLVQDRPVLGGNASSEMRMGIVGAHGADNVETGLLEELELNNFHFNPLLRYTLWDDVILSFVLAEPSITLLLNTSVRDVETRDGRIVAVDAWNANEYCEYRIEGALFADCSGDGILRLSGAEYRAGRESAEEFGETFSSSRGDRKTMGNSILLQLRHCSEHRPFIPPPWAHVFTDADFEVPDALEEQNKRVKVHSFKRPYPENNNFWWIEYGGNLDTIADAGEIQRELKRIAYGVWAYMKNHPDGRCRNYELDWIGSIPGKRESVRYVGDHILTQDDIMGGGRFEDVVCYGGWTLDDHDPDAFFKKGFLSTHHWPPSPFGIPYRCLYSRNIANLLFAGRDISCTHMGLSATRVMATCALMGQAVGTAAAIAVRDGLSPREVGARRMAELQDTLEEDDVMLPGRWRKVSPLALSAARASHEELRNGVDRHWQNEDNGAWLAPGAAASYEWDEAVAVSSVRVIHDTGLAPYGKRMPKLEALEEFKSMPAMLARDYALEARVDGEWRRVAVVSDNIHRLARHRFAPVRASALRLVVGRTWGGPEAHLFALDAR